MMSWMMIAAAIGLTAMVLLIIMIVLNFTPSDRLLVGAVFLSGAGVFCVSFLVAYLGGKKGDKEIAAGYTTSRWGYPNVEQVDGATGLIVRSAGEALLSRQVIRSRIAAYKASLEVPHDS